ncbi:MAG: orotate phosphoribosyltransferase [Chloroflexi bacterium HGW-Chloroflexi-3]|nr:MAG: orotate phosphoribosyltransferase [Chloroflexi bacterium HGW-Chloroflexi-3]
MNFFAKLAEAVQRNNSLLCVGLDPQLELLPPGESLEQSLVAWGKALIEQTSDLVCCYKPNIAFYEQAGPQGLHALQQTLAAIPEGIPILLDAKRGDIGSTADAYARAAYQQYHADAITISPYLGQDSIKPFLKDTDKAVFILCQTSNPSAREIQQHGEPPLFEFIAQTAKAWGSVDQIGFVIGATQPDALQSIRAICPEHWFLAPGVGAQGGDLAQALQAGLRADGIGMIIPVSRGVIYADNPRQAALNFRDAINAVRAGFIPSAALSDRERLIISLFEHGCVRFGNFTLASGKQSPIYIDIRRVISFPDLFKQAVAAYLKLLHTLQFDLVAGVPYAALPLSTVAAWKMTVPLIYPRKEAKAHGTGQMIEGAYMPGQCAVLMEDIITSGGSILTAAETLRSAGLHVDDVVVLVERKQGGAAALAEHGIKLHPVLNIYEVLDTLKAHGLIEADIYTNVIAYLQG